MDKITHEVRLADNDINEKTYYYWLRRVRREAYSQLNNGLPAVAGQDRASASFAEIPVENTADQAFDPFKADAVLRSGSLVIGISNSISDRLLGRLLEVADHAG